VTDKTITLDSHRGMIAQKETDIRRLLAEVAANEKALRERQEELELQLLAAPASTWAEAAEKARYLLGLFAATSVAQDPRRKMLIANVLEDFTRLSEKPPIPFDATAPSEGGHLMAKGQRATREKRKPKADKPKQVTPSSRPPGLGVTNAGAAGKKPR
jgi:hypothetical protein